MQSYNAGVDPSSIIWAGLVDGNTPAPGPSRFFRPRPEHEFDEVNRAPAPNATSTPFMPGASSSQGFRAPVHNVQQTNTAVSAANVAASSPSRPPLFPQDPSPWPQDELISTQPHHERLPIQPNQPIINTASSSTIKPPVNRHNPNVIRMEAQHKELAPHQITILPTDGAAACLEKMHHVGSLLDSGLTLAAHLGLFEGVPDRHTPESLAVEGMTTTEKQAWTWWSRLEATEPGSGSKALPPLDVKKDRAPVPPTAAGNKSNVAQKTPALELLYGFPAGTLSAEHVAYFLRPSNASHVVSRP